MTPLIREMIKHSPQPESFMWFDAGSMSRVEEHTKVPVEVLMNLPFPRTAICCQVGSEETKMVLALIAGDNSVTVAGYRTNPFNLFKPFVYMLTPEGLRYYFKDQEIPEDSIKPAFRIVTVALMAINAQEQAYQAVAPKTFVNQKRKAKGKQPLFDWHTVVIERSAPKKESQGGTHASPRLHDRRGHWRKTKGGKTVWVKSCKVGDASKGVVFKDYEVKGNRYDLDG